MRLLEQAGHRRWRRDLSAYVDGRLEPRQREVLERHLASCLRCQEEMAALQRLIALLRRVPQVEVPRSFALLGTPSPGLRWPALYGSSLRYATAVAAMLLLAVVVGDLVTGRPPALAPDGPGVAETQSREGAEKLQDTPSAATAAPIAGGQDAAQATPSPQAVPFAAAEKAQERAEAEEPTLTKRGRFETLHNWLRWGEIGIGAVLVALVSVAAVQWWAGRRRRQG